MAAVQKKSLELLSKTGIEKVLPWTEETVAEFRHNADYKGSKKFEDGIRHAEEFHKQLLEELAEENREKTEDGEGEDGGAADRKKKAKVEEPKNDLKLVEPSIGEIAAGSAMLA